MKIVLAPVAALLAVFISIPLVFANGANSLPQYACGQLGIILDTIRTLETRADYTARADRHGKRPNAGTASGAYQYINTTWLYWAQQANINTHTYPTADTAPPEIQDQVAGVNVASILNDRDGLVEAIPVIWYYPAAWGNDKIPAPGAGNTLTVREYQTKWMDTYNQKLAAARRTTPTPTEPPTNFDADLDEPAANNAATDLGLQPCSGTTDPTGQWALPAPHGTMTTTKIMAPHGYPAWDFITPPNTPIFAVTGGIVTNIQTWGGNWWRSGCQNGNRPATCSTCGIGVTIQHANGLRHTYCHGLATHVTQGDQIAPGQLVLTSGDSGRSGTPHLHLEFRINNIRYCPQTLILAIYQNRPIPEPATLPRTGC